MSRILIVEDEILLAKSLARSLKNLGYEIVESVATGEDAVRKAEETQPDLILMDIKLEGEIDGIEASSLIRSRMDAAIVYLTAHTATDLFERAKFTEPHVYLTKPVSPQELGRTVEMALYMHEADKRVRESEELHRITLSNISETVLVTDDEGIFTFICPNIGVIFGYSVDEVQTLGNVARLLGEGLVDPSVLQTSKEIPNIEWRVRDKSDVEHLLLISIKRVSIKGGTLLYTCRDITDRKKAEKAAQRQNALLNSTLEALTHPFYVINSDNYTIEAANSAAVASGISAGATCYSSAHKRKGPCDDIEHPCPMKEVKKTKRSVVVEHIHCEPDGSPRRVEVHAYPVLDSEGNVNQVIEYCVEITDSEKAEEALRDSHERFRTVMDSLDAAVYVSDMDTYEVLFINQRMRDVFGDVEGKTCWKSIYDDQSSPCEFCPNDKLIDDRGEPTGLYVWDTDNRKADGWWDLRYRAIRWIDGRLVRLQMASDITERKKAEERLRESDRHKAVADLSAGVSHNFNNMLQVVVGGSHLAMNHLETGAYSEARKALEVVINSSKHGAETVKRLQDFAGIGEEKTTPGGKVVDLSDIVHQSLEMSKPWWKSNPEKKGLSISLNRYLREGCRVKGAENELFEVVINLIKNSTEALPEGGEIKVRTFTDDDNVVLQVQDDGIGIPQENIARIFEPFFTTKGPGGTGMGLAGSYGIVHGLGGVLSVESTEGQGAAFTVTLPFVEEPLSDEATIAPELPRNLRILVIDDELAIVNMLKSGLERSGHTALTAPSGSEGLKIFREAPVDLVICDISMPGMSGWDVGRTIKEICDQESVPKPPFIILTGWNGLASEEENIVAAGVDAVVEKPMRISNLLAVISDVIRGTD